MAGSFMATRKQQGYLAGSLEAFRFLQGRASRKPQEGPRLDVELASHFRSCRPRHDHKKHWGNMPLPEIIAELDKKTGGKVLQSVMPEEIELPANVVETPLYFEVTF
jgi:hypothetical protein